MCFNTIQAAKWFRKAAEQRSAGAKEPCEHVLSRRSESERRRPLVVSGSADRVIGRADGGPGTINGQGVAPAAQARAGSSADKDHWSRKKNLGVLSLKGQGVPPGHGGREMVSTAGRSRSRRMSLENVGWRVGVGRTR